MPGVRCFGSSSGGSSSFTHTVYEDGRVKLFLPASLSGSSAPEADHRVVKLGDSSDSQVDLDFFVPAGVDLTGNFIVEIRGFTTGTDTSASYVFQSNVRFKKGTESFTANVFDETLQSTVSAPDGSTTFITPHQFEHDATNAEEGDSAILEFFRLGTNGSDDRTGNFNFTMAIIDFAGATL